MWEETRVCKECGKEKPIQAFKKTGGGYRLRTCRACNKVKVKQKPIYYECVNDPTNTYIPGCRLVRGQFRQCLNDGILPPGSVWKDTIHYNKYRVDGNQHYHDLVECLRNPDPAYLKSVQESQVLFQLLHGGGDA